MSNTRANVNAPKNDAPKNDAPKNDDAAKNDTPKNDDTLTDNDTDVEPTKGYVPPKEEESMIVMDRNYIDENGVQQVKRHGPVPASQWAAYEKEHNL